MRTSRNSRRLRRRPMDGFYRSARPVSVRTRCAAAARPKLELKCVDTLDLQIGFCAARCHCCFKSSSSPRRAAHASHSCARGLPATSKAAPQQQKDGRPPPGMGRLAGTHQLHRARLFHHRDGRARKALLCLETKRRRTLAVLRRQHVIDNVFAPGPRRDPCVEWLRRWFCKSLRFKGRQGLARVDGPPQSSELLSTSSLR